MTLSDAGGAALIALAYYLSQSAWTAGLGYWTLYRPLVAGAVVGLVLGDPLGGARIGAMLNLAALGFSGAGGLLSADISLAGYVGTAWALALGWEGPAAVALLLPLALLGRPLYALRLRWAERTLPQIDRCAAAGDTSGLARWHVFPSQALLLPLHALPCFALVYSASLWAPLVRPSADVQAGLAAAGWLLALLGLAQVLALHWERRTAVGYAAGALAAVALPGWSFAQLAAVSAAGALAQFWSLGPGETKGVADSAPGTAERGFPRRVLWACGLHWLFFSHAGFSASRLQGIGLAQALAPALRRIHPVRDALAGALQGYAGRPFVVEPNVGAGVVGAHLAYAVRAGEGRARDGADTATLAATTSALGHRLLEGTLAPLLLAMGCGSVLEGRTGAVIVYGIAIAVVIWGVTWRAFLVGWRGGAAALARWLTAPVWPRAERAGALCLAIIGGLLAARVGWALPAPALVISLLGVLATAASVRLLQRGVPWVHLAVGCYLLAVAGVLSGLIP